MIGWLIDGVWTGSLLDIFLIRSLFIDGHRDFLGKSDGGPSIYGLCKTVARFVQSVVKPRSLVALILLSHIKYLIFSFF
jgi:hypothetical protein